MAKQKYTEAKKNSNLKWDTANLDRMSLALPKGSREAIKVHAAALGESTNAFIKRAIDCQMERDGDGTASGIAGNPPESATGAGVVSLPPDTLEAAQRGAGRTGESVAAFVARAVVEQGKRDDTSFKMGINPA